MENKEYERCLRCNRKLKNASARKRGMGDICYKKYIAERKHKRLFSLDVYSK